MITGSRTGEPCPKVERNCGHESKIPKAAWLPLPRPEPFRNRQPIDHFSPEYRGCLQIIGFRKRLRLYRVALATVFSAQPGAAIRPQVQRHASERISHVRCSRKARVPCVSTFFPHWICQPPPLLRPLETSAVGQFGFAFPPECRIHPRNSREYRFVLGPTSRSSPTDELRTSALQFHHAPSFPEFSMQNRPSFHILHDFPLTRFSAKNRPGLLPSTQNRIPRRRPC